MSLKMRLRRFVIGASAGYRTRTPGQDFTQDLLACFGWDEDNPPTAEIPFTMEIVDQGKRIKRTVAAFWPERRVLIHVAKRDVMLDIAWKSLLRACLQVDPPPQYVILTNQRDMHLYDLARNKEAPRLTISLDQLPKRSEAFPFLERDWVPGTIPTIINTDVVTKKVAELVGRVYRSLAARHPEQEHEVIRFTLRCILSMFAEDIGLLPQEYFTSLLYAGAEAGDVQHRLDKLFTRMATYSEGPREIPYFNGDLFKNPVTFPLEPDQLRALTNAAEANWTHVDPHIFGSVFQGIMNDEERHASGAHYTAREDIMRVVGPTIVEPWRARINEAKTLTQLRALRANLSSWG